MTSAYRSGAIDTEGNEAAGMSRAAAGEATNGPQPLEQRKRQVFYSVAAQHDNLGDVVIRQLVLDWLSAAAESVHVFTGSMPHEYIDSYRMPSGARKYEASAAFSRSLLRACAHRSAALVLAPGPRVAASGPSGIRSAGSLVGMTSLVRGAGGPVVAVGSALSGGDHAALWLHRRNARMCNDYTVRDAASRNLLSGGVRLIPDIAWTGAMPVEHIDGGAYLAISLRFDDQIEIEELRRLVREARREHLRPMVVTQVRRDHQGHEQLATELGIEHRGWTDQTHREQLDRVEEVYRSSAAVYSNRLHACIFAARHGAVVINAESQQRSKLVKTLSTVYPTHMAERKLLDREDAILSGLDARRVAQARFTRIAADFLDHEREALSSGLSGVPHRRTDEFSIERPDHQSNDLTLPSRYGTARGAEMGTNR